MSAAGCRKNANFGGDSNPWGLRHPQKFKNVAKNCKISFGGARTAENLLMGERSATELSYQLRKYRVFNM